MRPDLSPAIDWLKALAIIAVVAAHAGPFGFTQAHPVDAIVRLRIVSFHVSVFLFVSGFLHSSATPLTAAETWRRLQRILGPYLVASLAITALHLMPHATWSALPWNLATGNAHGTYYYVLVWCGCVLSGLVWSRLRGGGLLAALALVAVATEWRSRHAIVGVFWGIRDPLFQGWLFCYLAGWCAQRYDALDVVRRIPRASVGVALVGSLPWLLRDSAATAVTDRRILYAASVVLLVTALARHAPPLVRWLSRETLWVYLAHMAILAPLVRATTAWPPIARLPVVAIVTLAACAAGIALARWLQRVVRPNGHRHHASSMQTSTVQ